MSERLSLHMTNSPAELGAVMRAAEGFLQRHGQAERTVYLVTLVMEEVLTNIIKYAYEDEDEHVIGIELTLGEQDVLITTEDDGREFDPLSVPPPRISGDIEDLQPGGLGIHLIRNLSHSVEYVRTDRLNRFAVRVLHG